MEMAGHCRKPCRHGVCMPDNRCKCNKGWFGRFCNQHGNLAFFLTCIKNETDYHSSFKIGYLQELDEIAIGHMDQMPKYISE